MRFLAIDYPNKLLYLKYSMNIYHTLTSDEREFLDAWEEIYKRGHLTFWVLLALSDKPLDAPKIHSTINTFSANNFYVTEQSLYRALRRFHGVGLIEISKKSDKRSKLYILTQTGRNVLKGFVERNIAPLYSLTLQKVIKEVST
jgi:DNA-binding PadR family transcriptional regulator